jgi:[acyl-carrier-protein] S-malonyltransferase
MAAWSVAGIWTADEALRLTDVRARLMEDAAGPDGRLGYVRGLDQSTLEGLLDTYRCEIAIRNPDRLVLGGSEQDVIDLCQEAIRQGAARSGLLAVKIASHTSRLAGACKSLQHALDASRRFPVGSQRVLLAGGDGERIFSASDATVKLARQVAHPIDWSATLEALAELGVSRVLDLGPGHALAEMTQAFLPDLRCYAADGFRSTAGLRKWISAA